MFAMDFKSMRENAQTVYFVSCHVNTLPCHPYQISQLYLYFWARSICMTLRWHWIQGQVFQAKTIFSLLKGVMTSLYCCTYDFGSVSPSPQTVPSLQAHTP